MFSVTTGRSRPVATATALASGAVVMGRDIFGNPVSEEQKMAMVRAAIEKAANAELERRAADVKTEQTVPPASSEWLKKSVAAVKQAQPDPEGKRLVLKRIRSELDSANGVEFIPLQGVGYPKRLVILRGREWLASHVESVASHLAKIDAYHNAPIRVLRHGEDIELYEVE